MTVDCMPTDDCETIPDEIMKKMLESASSGLTVDPESNAVKKLLAEINRDSARTSNMLALNAAIKADESTFRGLVVPDDKPEQPVPRSGRPDDYIGLEKGFDRLSIQMENIMFVNHIEIVEGMRSVHIACEPVEAMSLFSYKITRQVRLEEFEAMQSTSYEGVQGYLKNTWVPACKSAVISELGNIGAGWFNIHETSQKVYEVSPLNRFMRLVRQEMQDAIRTLTSDSCHNMAGLLHNSSSSVRAMVTSDAAAAAACALARQASNEARKAIAQDEETNLNAVKEEAIATYRKELARTLEWPADAGLKSQMFKSPSSSPLWHIDLVVDPETRALTFSTPVGPFEEAIIKIFNEGILHSPSHFRHCLGLGLYIYLFFLLLTVDYHSPLQRPGCSTSNHSSCHRCSGLVFLRWNRFRSTSHGSKSSGSKCGTTYKCRLCRCCPTRLNMKSTVS